MPLNELQTLARRHHGIVTAVEARRTGMTRAEMSTMVRKGIWIREARSVFRIAGLPVTYATRVTIAVAATGGRAAASHRSTPRLLELPCARRFDLIELTVPHGSVARAARNLGAVVHQSRHLTSADIATSPAGIPVTRPARMILECQSLLSPAELCLLIDEAIVRLGVTPTAIHRTAKRLAWPITPDLERALEVYGTGKRPDSPPEVQLARRLHAAGLPFPELLGVVHLPSGRVVEGDLVYREARVIVDYHGKLSHTARHLPSDAARSNDIQAAGWVHLTATDHDQTGLIDAVSRLLSQRKAG